MHIIAKNKMIESFHKIISYTIILEGDTGKDEEITMETNLVDGLNADSLDFVDLIMSLEDEFSLEFNEDDADKFKTVGDIVKHIEETL